MPSISKLILASALALGLSACATPDYVFKKLDASQMDFQNDLNKCEDEAMTFGNVIRADYIKARNDCLIKKGWTLTNPR
jgi:starvation-inducible outer membrane lipoprotein